MPLMALAVTWFRKEDWPRWLAIDPDFQPDYDHWLERSEAQLKALDKEGVRYERVLVAPMNFAKATRQ